jgi:hypothetical protein
MKSEYNSRQKKIYRDYNIYPDERLLEIVKNTEAYIPEVIDVIKDILSERHSIFSSVERETVNNEERSKSVSLNNEQEELTYEERLKSDESVKLFIKQYKEQSESDLSDIIIRHNSYQPEAVKAALIVSVDKGLISYDQKELLLKQIEENFASRKKRYKENKWETKNAFVWYVSRYNDDEIYNIIEDPNGIAIDVYHAILLTAKERELISDNDFEEYYKTAIEAIRTEDEFKRDEFYKFLDDSEKVVGFETEVDLEAETEKYWKCPTCNEMVGMEFSVCWNCQAEIPETVEHPDKEEIVKELAYENPFSPLKTGLIMIGGGILIGLFSLQLFSFQDHYHYVRLVFSALFILTGIVFFIIGLFFTPKNED